MILFLSLALARPDNGGGLGAYSDSDEIVSMDGEAGLVRVWYSVSGPSQTILDDADADGVPDFPKLVVDTAEAVLLHYEALGLRPPVSDGTRGGSEAMDAYLVDFAGMSDGAFVAEGCDDVDGASQCYGYFQMENDFAGYGYPDLDAAARTLTSHELFHAIQAAYDANEEVWWSEGTATWGEWSFDEGNTDFLSYCDAYLEDTGRSLDQPPSGPVPAFAYGTALWWYFLANRYGDDVIRELLEATASGDALLEDMAAIEAAHGGSIGEDWSEFAQWNLATGAQAGGMESYVFASSIGPPTPEVRRPTWTDDFRFYPLAATYVKIEHEGGPLYFAMADDGPGLVFSLHPEDAEGHPTEAIDTWNGGVGVRELGDLDAQDLWLVATNPTLDEDSTKALVCVGDEATIAECAVEDSAAPVDSGTPVAGKPEPTDEGCGGCEGGRGAAWLGALALLAVRRSGRAARA